MSQSELETVSVIRAEVSLAGRERETQDYKLRALTSHVPAKLK